MSGAANQSNKVAGSHTLTPAADQTVKQVPVEVKKAVVFFIGGAAMVFWPPVDPLRMKE